MKPQKPPDNSSEGLSDAPQCSLKGFQKVAMVKIAAGDRRPRCPTPIPLRPCRGRTDATQTVRPLQGRLDGCGRCPGAALRLPPATVWQASGLQSQPPILSRTRALTHHQVRKLTKGVSGFLIGRPHRPAQYNAGPRRAPVSARVALGVSPTNEKRLYERALSCPKTRYLTPRVPSECRPSNEKHITRTDS